MPTPISIHAPAWGATVCNMTRYYKQTDNFNPRSRVGSDGGSNMTVDEMLQFQSTLPRGERQHNHLVERMCKVISIHAPAWGATVIDTGTSEIKTISIHAPAWGATGQGRYSTQKKYISIHAPAWGATLLLTGSIIRRRHFNPRSRVGSDDKKMTKLTDGKNFNPRSRVGSDALQKILEGLK